jgi:RecJ-like exonuclease
MDEIEREIHNAPYYRLNEIVEDLDIELEEGFVGFN